MKQNQIKQLLERYLDGDTSKAEEEQLRQYFAETTLVPPEWRPYKALFAWETRETRPVCCDSIATNRARRLRRLAIAAGIAALVLLTATLLRQSATSPLPSGNYAIVEGYIITDAALVAQEAEQALLMVASTEEETFDAINIFEI